MIIIMPRVFNEIDAAAVYVNASTGLPMDMSLDLELRSESALRNFMQRPYGIKGTDYNQIYYLWKWADPSIILLCQKRWLRFTLIYTINRCFEINISNILASMFYSIW